MHQDILDWITENVYNKPLDNTVEKQSEEIDPDLDCNDHEPEHLLIECGASFRETTDRYVVIYTDGSCLGNGTVDAKAAIGVYFGPFSPLNIAAQLPSQYRQTNNTAEIVAVTRAILAAKKSEYTLIEIRTDSKFVIHCIKKYLPFWLKNGWLTTTGQPVINQPELEELYHVMKGVSIRLVHIKGHSGSVGNDRADFLARLANLKT
jgi:ribonuclease HI